ncbi:hypothetical protein GGF31_003811 [Allomyces arbusculus]|nr:hypothetical protein GGF31_003811 [Allomyces arbusculus]
MASAHPVVIVTGASRGYGAAIVRELFTINKQVRVVGVARSEHLLRNLQHALPMGQFEFVAGDLVDEKVAQKVVETTVAKYGRIDGVVFNAGVLEPMGPAADIPLAGVKHLFDVNLFSVLHLTQLTLPHLRASKGRAIYVSSGAATNAYHGWVAYNMSKAALNMLAANVGAEEPDVTAVSVRPGVLDTDMQAHIRSEGGGKLPKDMHDYFLKRHDEGSLVAPEVSGHVVAQLVLKAPKDLSGQFLDWQADVLAEFQKLPTA